MAIAGFEKRSQVEAVLAALEHEKKGAGSNPRHLANIEEQIRLFSAELERMEETGEGAEHVRTAHPAAGTAAFFPPWRPGISGQ